MSSNPNPFRWRAFASVLIAVSFLVLLVTGTMLFVSPPGRIANWTNWTLLGLTKHEWIGLHVWFSTMFLVVSVVHVVFNWRPLVSYFKDRMTRRIGVRFEWLAALGVCGLVFAGTQAGWPPFSSLLAYNERIKQSWETPQQRAPIPHAELLTLAELAQKAGIDLTTATNRLATKGLKGLSPDIIVQELAGQNRRSAQQIYDALLTPTSPGNTAHGAGPGRGGGGGGPGGGGPGGGPGRKTLTQFCADEGIDLQRTIEKLQAKGIKTAPEQTLREIAADHGYNRPYELLEIIRSK